MAGTDLGMRLQFNTLSYTGADEAQVLLAVPSELGEGNRAQDRDCRLVKLRSDAEHLQQKQLRLRDTSYMTFDRGANSCLPEGRR